MSSTAKGTEVSESPSFLCFVNDVSLNLFGVQQVSATCVCLSVCHSLCYYCRHAYIYRERERGKASFASSHPHFLTSSLPHFLALLTRFNPTSLIITITINQKHRSPVATLKRQSTPKKAAADAKRPPSRSARTRRMLVSPRDGRCQRAVSRHPLQRAWRPQTCS